MRRAGTVVLVSLLAASCGGRMSGVELGKVVVYRNGVAYFERYAVAEDGEVSLIVAKGAVDDLLKSLTVVDANTGETLPISFPGRSASDGIVRMIVRIPDRQTRKVKLSYISESPAWKPSYRLNLSSDGSVVLQGWAVVDNVSGEDWERVRVGVGSTSALSFRYDLWTVRDVHRQTLGHHERFATAPPTATGLVAAPDDSVEDEENADDADVDGLVIENKEALIDATTTKQGVTISQDYISQIPVPGASFESALGAGPGTGSDGMGVSFAGSRGLENQYVVDGVNTTALAHGGKAGQRSDEEKAAERERREMYLLQQAHEKAEAARAQRYSDDLAAQLNASSGEFAVEGVASPSQRHSSSVALSMAHHLRNELIERGVAPSRLTVRTRVGAEGEPTAIKIVPLAGKEAASEERQAVGESKFMSKGPVSIENQGSSMVPIVLERTAGKLVYLYDAQSPRGNVEFAFVALRFENPTDNHLDAGPMTVFRDDAFVGEGLTDAIAPGAITILPYALDRQVHVDREEGFEDEVTGIERIVDDSAIVTVDRRNRVSFTVHNRSVRPATVYLRHDLNRGWKLHSGPDNIEQVGNMNVFSVDLNAGEKKLVELVESTPVTRTLDLMDEADVAALSSHLVNTGGDASLVEAGKRLAEMRRAISRKLKMLDHTAGQLVIFRDRLDELHAQVFTLEAVRSRGRHVRDLRQRMAEMSQRVERAITSIIELKEEIMVDRLTYRDLLAELSDLVG